MFSKIDFKDRQQFYSYVKLTLHNSLTFIRQYVLGITLDCIE